MNPSLISLGGCEIVNSIRLADLAKLCDIACGNLVSLPGGCWADRFSHAANGPRYWGPGVTLPWHRSEYPESYEFYGFHLESYSEGQMLQRSPSLRASGGSVAGPPELRGREIKISLLALASSPRGLRFGIRWLTSILEDLPSCDGVPMSLRTSCPLDGGEWTEGLWHLTGVTALTGVTESDPQGGNCCSTKVEFGLIAQDRWLSTCPETCAEMTDPGPDDGLTGECFTDSFCLPHRVCCQLRPAGIGREAARITIRVGDRDLVGPVFINRYPDPNDMGCPPPAGRLPDLTMVVMGPVPALHDLVIDASNETVTLIDRLAQTSSDGASLLTFVEGTGFSWMTATGCRPYCVCVEARGSCMAAKFQAQIETIHQEVAG